MTDKKDQFKADRNLWGRAHSGWRDTSKLLWGIFHTTENSDDTPPDNVAQWQLDTANQSSYNLLFGTDGRTVRSNDDDYSPWSTGMPGNRLGAHASAIGYASRSRADWLKYPKQLEALAQWAADINRRYGIPLRWLSVEEVAGQRVKGFTSHGVYWLAIGKARGLDVRTDPGPGFPHDLVLARAKEINDPTPLKGAEVDNAEANEIDFIADQLVGHPWRDIPGWPQLGGLSLVDAVATIGAHLDIDGFKDMRG